MGVVGCVTGRDVLVHPQTTTDRTSNPNLFTAIRRSETPEWLPHQVGSGPKC
jgi:hypothetical protein